MKSVFDPNPGNRTDAEWRMLLGDLVESLSTYTGILFAPTSWFIDDHPGYASVAGCVDVRGSVSAALRLEACAVVCVSVNHGKAAGASANMLLYSGGHRVFGPGGTEIVYFRYTPDGWSGLGWMNGECGEWEGYLTDERWQPGVEPGSAT